MSLDKLDLLCNENIGVHFVTEYYFVNQVTLQKVNK